jgi:hypothetical protein
LTAKQRLAARRSLKVSVEGDCGAKLVYRRKEEECEFSSDREV